MIKLLKKLLQAIKRLIQRKKAKPVKGYVYERSGKIKGQPETRNPKPETGPNYLRILFDPKKPLIFRIKPAVHKYSKKHTGIIKARRAAKKLKARK